MRRRAPRPKKKVPARRAQLSTINSTSHNHHNVTRSVSNSCYQTSLIPPNHPTDPSKQKAQIRTHRPHPRQTRPAPHRKCQNRTLPQIHFVLLPHKRTAHRSALPETALSRPLHEEERNPPLRRCFESGILLAEKRRLALVFRQPLEEEAALFDVRALLRGQGAGYVGRVCAGGVGEDAEPVRRAEVPGGHEAAVEFFRHRVRGGWRVQQVPGREEHVCGFLPGRGGQGGGR